MRLFLLSTCASPIAAKPSLVTYALANNLLARPNTLPTHSWIGSGYKNASSRQLTPPAAAGNSNGAGGKTSPDSPPSTNAVVSSTPPSSLAASPTTVTAAEQAPPQQLFANLIVRCPDAKGVVAALSQLLYGLGCNIVSSDQFSDESSPPQFYQRIEIEYGDCLVGPGNAPAVLERGISDLAARYKMDWKISYRNCRKRVALLVSRLDHCLYDILIRHEAGELDCDIPVVISNWPDLAPVAAKFGVEFKHLPVTADTKAQQEAQLEALLEELKIDVVVLARYMQIFSKEFADRNWKRTINVHHGSLPAFQGAKPYHRAYDRGVKIIGATAHFATSELDCGPIIAQDVCAISHRDNVADLIRKGRDMERLVLSRALRWYLEDRVLVTTDNGKTVVFED